MNQESSNEHESEMLDEYDFSGGVRGKYAARFAQGSSVVVLDPDVAQVFADSESVNRALRALVRIIEHHPVKGVHKNPFSPLEHARQVIGMEVNPLCLNRKFSTSSSAC